MENFFEELRPKVGENFQVTIQKTSEKDLNFTPPHYHDFIEVLYCLCGNYKIIINNEEFYFGAEDMIVIGSRKIHEISNVGHTHGKYLVIKFQPEMIYSSYNSAIELKYVLPFMFNNSDGKYIFNTKSLENSPLKTVFEDISNEIEEKKYGYEIALKSDIYKLILWIIRKINEENHIFSFYTTKTLTKIENALSYIESHYKEKISVKEIAGNSFMEYTYFSRIFKKITGLSCTEYINSFRVNKAESLIISTGKSISEISDLVGFDNVSYFIKQFKHYKGISPKQYKKKT